MQLWNIEVRGWPAHFVYVNVTRTGPLSLPPSGREPACPHLWTDGLKASFRATWQANALLGHPNTPALATRLSP
jgi:hypothetical protein